MGRRPTPQVPRPPNPFRQQKEIKAPTPIRRTPAPKAPKRVCPNKECTDPKIEDGFCVSCGAIVDDFNIVSEVQFGENSQGAAVAQGTYISADQGAARGVGIGARPGMGHVDRERIVHEGKPVMQALSNQLLIPESTIQSGLQILKLAAQQNFIQGRRLDMVAAVCLYSACRKERPCRVMLIDFADRLQVNVFKLGHTFKALHMSVTLAKDGIQPILPEDLIYRFASKLDFGQRTGRVAEDAVRMVKRMSQDWMVMGRRPSGVCGACLILAARMNNFRRTVTEVVYVVKVTTHTIQKRLEEFKLTPSSELTVEEFINNEFLEQAHDPPSYYEKQEDFIKNKKTRKRKRRTAGIGEDEEGDEDGDPNQRQRTAEPVADHAPTPVEHRKDADGFAIPLLPQEVPIDPDIIDEESGVSFEKLVEQFGDELADTKKPTGGSGDAPAVQKPRRGPDNRPIFVPEEWEADERALESAISEMISDPNTQEHAIAHANAVRKTDAYMRFLEASKPANHRPVNMDTHIGEDEFANDPEVENCVLSPADIAIKEQIWLNDNRTWLRKQQIKATAKRLADLNPNKTTRNRTKKPRIGEGQTSPASTPGEAAVGVLKTRMWSSKINYDIYKTMLDTGPVSRLGSVTTSRATSRAGSVGFDSTAASSTAGSVAGSVAGSEIGDGESQADIPDDESVAADPADDWKKQFMRPQEADEYGAIPDVDDDNYDDADEFGDGFGRDDDDVDVGFGDDD